MNEELLDYFEEELKQLEFHFMRSAIVDEIGEDAYKAMLEKALQKVKEERTEE